MPQNQGFYHAAYGVALTVYAVYTLLLWRRRARVRAELARLGIDADTVTAAGDGRPAGRGPL